MATKNKKTFTAKDRDNNDIEITVKVPDLNDIRAGERVKNTVFRESLESGCYLREKLDEAVKAQNLWSDEKEAKFAALKKELLDNELALAKGGIPLKDAKQLAINMRKIRGDIMELRSIFTNMNNFTCESKAENEQFNKLVSLCLLKPDKTPYYSSLEDYLNNNREELARKGAEMFAAIYWNYDEDSESKLPENSFLKKYGFCNDKFQLTDSKGRLVDANGKLINEEGRYITESGELCDSDGNLVDENGNFKLNFTPFLDDSGEPVGNVVPTAILADENDSLEPKDLGLTVVADASKTTQDIGLA